MLEEPEFFPCNTFFGRFTSSRRSRRIFYFRFRRDGALLRSKSREIAPKTAVPHVLKPGHDPPRSPDTVPSVGMPRHVRFGAILGELRTEFFEKNFAAAKFCDRNRARSRRNLLCHTCYGLQRLTARPRFVNCHAVLEII